jgi:hypothetical protein
MTKEHPQPIEHHLGFEGARLQRIAALKGHGFSRAINSPERMRLYRLRKNSPRPHVRKFLDDLRYLTLSRKA